MVGSRDEVGGEGGVTLYVETLMQLEVWHLGHYGSAIDCPSPPLGSRRVLAPPTGPGRSLDALSFVCAVSNRSVFFLFKEQGTYYHDKGALATGPFSLVVCAKKGDVVNRW